MTEAKYPDHIHPIERRIIDAAIKSILAAGHTISVYGDGEMDLKQSADYAEITSHVAACSETEFRIWTRRAADDDMPRKVGWVHFVHGNETQVLIDYTVGAETEALLERANTLAEVLEADPDGFPEHPLEVGGAPSTFVLSIWLECWCEKRGYPLKSADELAVELQAAPVFSKADVHWLQAFGAAWDHATEQEARAHA